MQKQDIRDNFNIILLAAGLSSRLGGEQKITKAYRGETLLFYSLTASLNAFDTILVVGHQKESVIRDANRMLQTNKFKHNLNIVYNEHYKDGQYTSIQSGVKNLKDGVNFAIMTGDVPFVLSSDFITLSKELKDYDILRPFVNNTPCHPVFLNYRMRDYILSHNDVKSVRELIEKYKAELKVKNYPYSGNDNLTKDFDYKECFLE